MARDERIRDLFFTDQTSEGAPTEEGLVRRVSDDLVAFIDGQAKSLTAGGGAMPPATEIGQVLFSEDGATFTAETPLTSCEGWLVNNDGILLVV